MDVARSAPRVSHYHADVIAAAAVVVVVVVVVVVEA